VAEGIVNLPAVDHTMTVISDDGVRVWVDDALVIDAWAPHESKVDSVKLTGGPPAPGRILWGGRIRRTVDWI